ncbi:MAG: ECF transporter S component [Christensenellales bacterium]|jgi:uncharacterized membrane protein
MKNKTLFWVQMALFTAIELLFCFTVLGSLPISPGIVATLAHIPALIVALTLGKKAGAFIGAVMGLSALIIWTSMPPNPLVAFAFSPFVPNGNIWSLLICVVPRIIFPVFAAWLFEMLKRRRGLVLSACIAAAAGTFVHSLLVLSGIYLAFHGNETVGGSYTTFLVAWGGLNAIIEIVIAAIVAGAVIVPLKKVNAHRVKKA